MGWFTGDVLSVFGMWASWAVSAGLAAVTVPPGRSRRILWILAVCFAVGGLAQLVIGARLPLSVLLPISYMITPPLTVLVVALLVSGKSAPSAPATNPPKKDERLTLASEVPDVGLAQAYNIVARSIWAEDHKPSPEAILREVRDKLHMHKLTAFGRREPSAPIEPIPPRMWAGLEVDPKRQAAVTLGAGEVAFHDLQFDQSYVRNAWPARGSWMGV